MYKSSMILLESKQSWISFNVLAVVFLFGKRGGVFKTRLHGRRFVGENAFDGDGGSAYLGSLGGLTALDFVHKVPQHSV
jgi:hypothetical protein